MSTTHLDRRGWYAVGLSLVLFLAVMAVQFAIPPEGGNTQAPPIRQGAAVGTTVHMREGDFTVTGVSVARSVNAKAVSGMQNHTTSGIWLLVGYRFEARVQRSAMDVRVFTASNVEYRISGRLFSGNDDTLAEDPGFPVTGTFAIEMPKDALAGSVLTVGNEGLYGAPLNDDLAVVDLGLSRARAAQLIAKAPAAVNVREP